MFNKTKRPDKYASGEWKVIISNQKGGQITNKIIINSNYETPTDMKMMFKITIRK